MEQGQILERMNEISAAAKGRMNKCSGWMSSLMGGAEIDFMTQEEKDERHKLMLLLPTMAEERQAARERIKERIAARRRGKK